MNIEHLPRRAQARRVERPTSNIEWKKMKKHTYDLEERLLKEKMNIEHRTSNIEHRMGKNEETEELIKIFVASIKTAEKKQK